jgi:hypothetical protein
MTQTKLYLIDIPHYYHLVHLENVVETMEKSKKWISELEDLSASVTSNCYTYDKEEYERIINICNSEEYKTILLKEKYKKTY